MDVVVIEWNGFAAVATRFSRQRAGLVFQGRRTTTVGEDPVKSLQELAGPLDENCRVVLALPPGHVYTRELDFPLRDRRKLREVLPLELRGETAVDTDELVFDAIPLEEGKVFALWMRETELEEAIRIATAAGVEPEVVTVLPAEWSALLPEGEGASCVAIADGRSVVVFRERQPLYFRALAGWDELSPSLAALEISRGIRPGKVYLLGETLPEAAAEASWSPLPVAASLADAFAVDPAAARSSAGAFAAATGLLSGAGINFRSGRHADTRGREAFRKRLRLPSVLASLLALLLLTEGGVRYFLTKRDLVSLDASIGAIYREVFPKRKKGVDEPAEVRAEIRKLSTGGSSGNILEALKSLADAKGDDITGLVEADISGGQVRIKGEARTTQGVTDFKNRLAGAMDPVETGEIKSRPDGTVTFTMQGTIKGEGK